jgi:hypothetical protein
VEDTENQAGWARSAVAARVEGQPACATSAFAIVRYASQVPLVMFVPYLIRSATMASATV